MDRAVPYLLVGLLAIALVVVIGAVAVRGVQDLTDDSGHVPPEGEGWTAPRGPDPAFVYSTPARVAMPRPLHLTAPLPRTADEIRMPTRPARPVGLIRGRLAHGDEHTQVEVLSALRAASEDGATDAELGAVFDPLLGDIDAEEHCAWLRDVLAADPEVPLRRSFWDALIRCDDPATASFLERDDVPAETLITWWETHYLDGGPVPGEALLEAIGEVGRERRAGTVLRGAQLLVRTAPERADELAELARRLPTPEMRGAVRELAQAAPAEPQLPGYDERVRSPMVSLELLTARTTARDRVARALVRCAAPTGDRTAEQPPVDEARAAECLSALHGLRPAMAVQAARAARRWGIELPHLRETVHALLEVGDRQAMRWRLSAHWDLPGETEHPGPPSGVAARDVLRDEHRALCFPTDTGVQPVDYRELLQRVAHLAPALRDPVFDQVPPGPQSYDYQLDAHLRGERFTVYAYDQGSVIDVPVVLGLLNALLRDQGSDVRYALLAPPRPRTTCLVAGPEQGLLDLEEQGLLTLAEPQ